MTDKKLKITKNMKIGDMVSKYPETADVMLSWGLACVGCSISSFESVEEGARGHGQMSDKEIEKLLLDLNEVAKPIKFIEVGNGFMITERALKKVKEVAKAEGKSDQGLRIKVNEEDGDREYELEFKKKPGANGRVFNIDNQKIFIDPVSLDLLKDMQMDYIETPLQNGFKFDHR